VRRCGVVRCDGAVGTTLRHVANWWLGYDLRGFPAGIPECAEKSGGGGDNVAAEGRC